MVFMIKILFLIQMLLSMRLFSCNCIKQNLRVMDLTAITLCKENNLPIHVFDINEPGFLKEIVLGSKIGTLVKEDLYND